MGGDRDRCETTVGGQPVVAKQLVGHVDNSACPAIKVDIQMTLVVPADAKGPVPVLMMFGGRATCRGGSGVRFPGAPERRPRRRRLRHEQLIAAGWGYARSVPPASRRTTAPD